MTMENAAEAQKDQNSGWNKPVANYLLWTIQVLVAALFLFAGGMKLVLPIEAMTKEMVLPGWFLRFIGVAEVTGALGLLLPWFFGLKRVLTPLAASGLVVIMIGATTLTLRSPKPAQAITPFVVGILLIIVAYGRSKALKQFPASDNAAQAARVSNIA